MRQVELARGNLAGDDRAERRETHAAYRQVARVHLIRGPLMLAFAVIERADQGDVLHLPGDVGPRRGNADAADGGVDRLGRTTVGRAGLRIESLELTGPAAHEEQDAGHAPPAQLIGAG